MAARNNDTLIINASMLDDKPTGAGVFSYSIINHLLTVLPSKTAEKVVIYAASRKFLDQRLGIRAISRFAQAARYKKIAAVYRLLWNQVRYSFIARDFALSFSPTTHGSFFLTNQVITILDLLSLRYSNISPHQRFYFRVLLPILVKKARKIITISEASKADIIHFLKCPPQKIAVVGCGYDSQLYRQLSRDQVAPLSDKYHLSQFIVAVGPTFPHKNYERLLAAYASLNDDLRGAFPLVIIGGKGGYIETLKKLVRDKNLTSSVLFLGYVPLEEMPLFYNAATALIYPSLFEGFGLPPLEAMACGCPVVASNSSSLPEVCGDAARYIDPLDAGDIARGIQAVLTSEELRKDLAEKGLMQARRFSWEKSAHQLKATLDQLWPQ